MFAAVNGWMLSAVSSVIVVVVPPVDATLRPHPKKDELIRPPVLCSSRKLCREAQCVSWAAECDHKGPPRLYTGTDGSTIGMADADTSFFGSSIRFLWPKNLVTKEGLDRCCS